MRRALRSLGIVVAVILPALLVVSSVRTYRAMGAMREVYLRHRAAMMAYQLEINPEDVEELRAHEPELLGVEIFSGPLAGGVDMVPVNALFRGETLYCASDSMVQGRHVYRVYLPMHRRQAELNVARLDVAASAADFLVRDGQRHLLLALLAAAGSLLLLGAYLLATRRRLERERLAELGEMSAVLAHEIRNPLGTIKGFVQLAAEKSDVSARSLLDPVLRETERLEKLVRDLLLFARPQPSTPETVRWDDLAAKLRVVASETKKVSVQVDAAPDLQFRTDLNALFRILSNLVRNSAEALDRGGAIRLSARSAPGVITIRVEDNGPGLTNVAREKAFQPFFTTKAFGTGLGLPISRRLARQLGGSLELEPVEPHGVRAVLTVKAG